MEVLTLTGPRFRFDMNYKNIIGYLYEFQEENKITIKLETVPISFFLLVNMIFIEGIMTYSKKQTLNL